MTLSADTMRQVEERAGGRCEYCRMHQSLQGATFHFEHIAPKSLGGSDALDNLAWSCPTCNLKKSNRVEAIDPEAKHAVRLFRPRADRWSDHFAWQGYTVVGLTAIGRTAIAALDLNNPRKLLIRQSEEYFGLFPPP